MEQPQEMMDKFAENISKHFGLPWSGLIEQYRKANKEKPPDTEDLDSRPTSNTTKLKREDAAVFGKWPSLDNCCLTLCGKCGAIIKPQALYSHIERRHNELDDNSTVEHLTLQKPVQKGLSLKAKVKNSPRSSPKPASHHTTDTNVLDKYQLPKPGSSKHLTSKMIPRSSMDQANSALARHLSSGSLPVQSSWSMDETLSSKSLNDVTGSPSSSSAWSVSTCKDSLVSTPKSSSHAATSSAASSLPNKKSSTTKRSLEAGLADLSKSEPPVKKSTTQRPASLNDSNTTVPASSSEKKVKPLTIKVPAGLKSKALASSPLDSPTLVNASRNEPEMTVINTDEFKQPTQKLLVPTTVDKHIPCKDREYDPNRHCGCWLEEWGKHCTRSLTCKTHALSLRRKVPGRSKPFDQLLSEHREAKEALEKAKALEKNQQISTKASKSEGKNSSASSMHHTKANNQRSSSGPLLSPTISEPEAAPTITDDHTKFDSPTYSSFHPRPLSTSRYGARLCGSSYVPNRQLDFIRMALCCAIEQPKPLSRKASAPKPNKSGTQTSDLTASTTQKSAASSKKKKAKRASIDSNASFKGMSPSMSPATSLGSPSLTSPVTGAAATSMNSSISVIEQQARYQHNKILSPSLNKSLSASPHQSTGLSVTQASHAALLQSLNSHTNHSNTMRNAGAGTSSDLSPAISARLNSPSISSDRHGVKPNSSFQLRTTGAGIGSLGNKAVIDGSPYAAVLQNAGSIAVAGQLMQEQASLGGTNTINVRSADSLAAKNGALSTVISGMDGQHQMGDGQTTLVEFVPQATAPQTQAAAAFRYVRQDGAGINGTENRMRPSSAVAMDKMQHYTLTNGGTIANVNPVLTMHLKHQPKQKPLNVSLTIPLVSQTGHHAQQATLHHTTAKASHAATASAHQGLT